MPSFNPDGQIMVTEWYRKDARHRVRRRVAAVALPEVRRPRQQSRRVPDRTWSNSQYMAKMLFRDWIPQAYVDHHHMGGNGARIYLPPYAEPVRPSADPLVWRELAGTARTWPTRRRRTASRASSTTPIYSGWGHMGFHWITPFHNIAGMLTESASARLASPLTMHPDQLERQHAQPARRTRSRPTSRIRGPAAGGGCATSSSAEDLGVGDARSRGAQPETVLWNAYLKAKRQTERGAAGKPTGLHRLRRAAPARSAHGA